MIYINRSVLLLYYIDFVVHMIMEPPYAGHGTKVHDVHIILPKKAYRELGISSRCILYSCVLHSEYVESLLLLVPNSFYYGFLIAILKPEFDVNQISADLLL